MNNFTYENQGTNTYLVYKIEEDDTLDTMSLGMITNNKISGLAPSFFMQMDMSKYIKYNVSAKISVSQFFEGSVNQKRLIGVFSGIVDAMLSAEDYMIDTNSILMDLDYIFADVSTCETNLICLPLIDTSNQNVNLGAFFKNIMFSTRFDQTENCDYVAQIINYLNSTPVFSLVDFKELLEKIKGNGVEVVPVQPVQKQQTKPSEQPVVQRIKPVIHTPPQPVAIQQPVIKPQPFVTPAQPASGTQVQSETKEKKKGMFGFLSSLEKEDKDLKKKQKKEEKLQKESEKQQAKASKKEKKKSDIVSGQFSDAGFAIPGQDSSFAIPGQAAPYQTAQPSVQTTHQVQKANPVHQVQQQTANPVQQQPAYVPRQVPQGKGANFGETTVLGGGAIGETTVLTAANNPAQMIAPHLIRSKNNEKISLNKPVFRIGKERSYVDYFIGDNTAISRSHANFITREREYFVVDTNSTNHTFLNGEMIQSNVEVNISHGDTIRLANEDFEFRLY